VKGNPFSSRQSLLTSIDLGMLNSPPQKQPESSCFDAEFHPSPCQEASIAKTSFLTQSSIETSTSKTIHTNPLVPDCRRQPPLHPKDSVHSGTGCPIPVRSKIQPTLQQSPVFSKKPLSLNGDCRVTITPIDRTEKIMDGSLSDNGGKKESVPQLDFLSRSAINPTLNYSPISSPCQRNPLLRGRSPCTSSEEISSPV